jgi:hypothetical protein
MTDLHEAIDALVPQRADVGNWEDVLRRAGVERKLPRRTVIVALLVLAAVAVPVLVAAVLTRTDVLFTHSKPAPNIVKKRFLDLSFGAPPRFAFQTLAAQTREVGTFRFGRHDRKLWVAPTRGGGYCYMFEEGSGGCVRTTSDRRPIGASYMMGDALPRTDHGLTAVTRMFGVVGDKTTARVEVHYADGTMSDVPFIYVSDPIDAGFFVLEVPASHLTKATRATAIVALDKGRRELGRQTFLYEAPNHPRPRPTTMPPHVPQSLPATPKVPPTEPAQRGVADGYAVVAGANGVVVFRSENTPPSVEKLMGHEAAFGCFKLVREFGIFSAKGMFVSGRFASTTATRIYGLPHPWDGCEIQGSYGHRWPDRNDSHSAVEIPLTEKGRRYFVDRAAARDLALFVRSRDVQGIRRETGTALERGLGRYPIVRVASPSVPPPVGKIGWVPTENGVTFVERSPTGRRFFVEVRDKKIVRKNVKPYAFVF